MYLFIYNSAICDTLILWFDRLHGLCRPRRATAPLGCPRKRCSASKMVAAGTLLFCGLAKLLYEPIPSGSSPLLGS